MKRAVPSLAVPLALVAASLLGTACGDLSQEDLLFRAALPSKSEIEVRPAGLESAADASDSPSTNTRALERECDGADLRCTAQNVADGLNGITFALLDIVDAVTALPPTERSRGRRVWGPHYELRNNTTSRFEMVRLDDGVTYAFCLHAARGRVTARDIGELDCDVDRDEDSGLALILSGAFTPGDIGGARARTGTGEMILELSRVPDLVGAGRQLEIVFDNDEDRTDISITLIGARVPGTVTEREPAHYEFTREADGSGEFFFESLGNIAEESVRLETLTIEAKWNADQAGRADGSVVGGDVPAGASFVVSQCWDTAGADVYLAAGVPPDLTEEGDAGQCVIPESLLDG